MQQHTTSERVVIRASDAADRAERAYAALAEVSAPRATLGLVTLELRLLAKDPASRRPPERGLVIEADLGLDDAARLVGMLTTAIASAGPHPDPDELLGLF